MLLSIGCILVFAAGTSYGLIIKPPCITVNCFINPCQVARPCTAHPNAICVPNYCGGCNYDYKVNGQIVSCSSYTVCKPNFCKMYCKYGFDKDDNGCEICKCRPSPVPAPIKCNNVMCALYCANGYETDSRGCPICRCKSSIDLRLIKESRVIKNINVKCPAMLCDRFCRFGHEVDENGCKTCRCRLSAKKLCHPVMCMIHCFRGFQLDDDQCETCSCL